jgi:hypothetical protein
MRMTKGEAIVKGSLKRASPKQSTIKGSKPPEPNDKRRNDEDSIGAMAKAFLSCFTCCQPNEVQRTLTGKSLIALVRFLYSFEPLLRSVEASGALSRR